MLTFGGETNFEHTPFRSGSIENKIPFLNYGRHNFVDILIIEIGSERSTNKLCSHNRQTVEDAVVDVE